MTERWWLVVCLAVIVGLGTRAHIFSAPHAPARRDATQAKPWMIDALPGIGGKRLTETISAVHREDFAHLQKPAQQCAKKVFSAGPDDDPQSAEPETP